MDRRTIREVNEIVSDLNRLKRRYENIAQGINREFQGIGEGVCSSSISSIAGAYEYIQNEISEIN